MSREPCDAVGGRAADAGGPHEAVSGRVADAGEPHDAVSGRVAAVREAMAGAGVDALVLRPSPDYRFLGGGPDSRAGAFIVVTGDAVAETADPAGLVPEGARRVGVDPEMRVRELFGMAIEAELVPASSVLARTKWRPSAGRWPPRRGC